MLWRKFRPPRRLGTIPYRALVPRLLRQMALSNGLKLALDCSRIGDTYANAVPIHLEVWLWAGRDYGVSLVQFILREDQLATRIEACSIGYMHICLPNVQDWLDWMPMLCQSTFSCNASVNGSSIDTWTDRHAIICYFSAGLPLNWQIGTGLALD